MQWKAKCHDGKCEQVYHLCNQCKCFKLLVEELPPNVTRGSAKCIKCGWEGIVNLFDLV